MIKSQKIICQCDYDKQKLIHRHPLLSKTINKKTRILINNVNPSWIVNNSKNRIDDFLLEEKNKFRICFIGNFDTPRKGHQLLLNAAEEILKKDSDIEFVLIGGGDTLEIYKSQYANKNIIFTGKLDNPNKILQQSDLLVVPSYADSCPNTIMEALYNKVPVIGSRAGGIPEILIDDNSLFDLNKISLVEKIRSLKHNKEEFLKLRENQKKRCKELTFAWGEKMIELIFN